MSESDKSGKPELTAEDKERIDAWIKPRILTLTHCATDWEFAQEAAEYATLHERSAAQARIAELEATLYQKEMEFTQLLAEFKDKQP